MKSNWRDIDVVNHNLASSRLNNSEKCLYESGFTTSCSPNNASFQSSTKFACKTAQDKWEMWSITNLHHGQDIITNVAQTSGKNYAMKYVGMIFLFQKLISCHYRKENLDMNLINQLTEKWKKTKAQNHKHIIAQTTFKSCISTSPYEGQEGSGRLSSTTREGSQGIQVYWSILSTDIILFSILQRFHIIQACTMFKLSPYVTAKPARPSKSQKSYKRETIMFNSILD